MKVLQINSVCGIGSTGRFATDLYSGLKANGQNCLIAYGRGKPRGIARQDTYRIGSSFEVAFHGAMARLDDRSGFHSTIATKRLIKVINKYKPDVIHLHNLHGYFLDVRILLNYLASVDVPVIWTFHDCWNFTGHCAYFDLASCSEWLKHCEGCRSLRDYPASFLRNCAVKNLKIKRQLIARLGRVCVVSPSIWLAGIARQTVFGRFEIEVIRNGIDLSVFKPTPNSLRERYGLDNRKVVLGVASRWDKRKGLEYLLDLATQIPHDYSVVIIGIDTKQIRKLPANILGIRRTKNTAELAAWYSCADVFVNPTLEDNYPTTNLEALACGTPVVTFSSGGSGEAVAEGCGIIVESRKVEDLLLAVKHIINSQTFIKSECLKASQAFDIHRAVQEYMRLYEKMMIFEPTGSEVRAVDAD